jgi:hypothetical protein
MVLLITWLISGILAAYIFYYTEKKENSKYLSNGYFTLDFVAMYVFLIVSGFAALAVAVLNFCITCGDKIILIKPKKKKEK